MKSLKRSGSILFSLLLLITISVTNCGKKDKKEISNHKEIVSCKYVGLSERNGRPIVELIFKNRSGKNFNSVFGSIHVINQSGEVLQRTGFTYSRPFTKDEEKLIPAFNYIDLKPNALQTIKAASGYNPVRFLLDEIIYENDESVKF